MVWERVEPVRVSRPPSPAVTEKVTDARTLQFWDPDQLVSAALRAAAVTDSRWPKAQLPEEEGVIWDSVLVFPAGARWDEKPPTPTWAGGDIIDVIDELDRRVFRETSAAEPAERPVPHASNANLPRLGVDPKKPIYLARPARMWRMSPSCTT